MDKHKLALISPLLLSSLYSLFPIKIMSPFLSWINFLFGYNVLSDLFHFNGINFVTWAVQISINKIKENFLKIAKFLSNGRHAIRPP
jgi:hypothetical protein